MTKLVIRKKTKYILKHYMSLYYKCISSKGYNGNKLFWKEKLHVTNVKVQHALMNGPFFFLGGRGKGGFFLSFSLVPIVFPSCSHQALKGFPSSQSVPECVPQDVPNRTWVLIGPKFNSHIYKLKR
jgi:hypothetical protein